MGSKRERSPGVWELRAYAGYVEGRRQSISRTFRGTAKAADVALARLVVDVADGAVEVKAPPVDRANPPLSDWMADWYRRQSPEWSPTSSVTAESHIRLHIVPALGHLRVRDITVRHIQEWLHDLRDGGLAPATRRRVFGVLRSALEQAERWEVIDRNPAGRVELPKVPYAEPRWPSGEDLVAAIKLAPNPHVRTLIWLAAATGGRRGQLVALRWSDIDLVNASLTFHVAAVATPGGVTIKAPKGGKPIQVPLDELTVDVIKAYRRHRQEIALGAGVGRLKDRSYLFARDPAGTECWYPDRASKIWASIRDVRAAPTNGQKVGPLLIPSLQGVRLHDLRHAHATLLIAHGVDRRVVADRLGHSAVSTTDRYTHRVTAADRAAAQIIGEILAGAS